jgi:hypothetical protein
MINYTFKKDQHPIYNSDWSNFYQKSFALALINWEINRQEDRLKAGKTAYPKK